MHLPPRPLRSLRRARARGSGRAERRARARRTRCSSLLWQLPMRDLLGLLRKHPDLYRSACRQAVPSVHFDWLAIVNKARGLPARGACACPRVGLQLPQCQDAATAVHCQADGVSAAYVKRTAVAAVPPMLYVPSLDITVFYSTTPCSQSRCLRQLEPRTPKVVCTCGGD